MGSGSVLIRGQSLVTASIPAVALAACAGGEGDDASLPMSLDVTVDVFSGRENPVVSIRDDETITSIVELIERVLLNEADQNDANLGFRGFVVVGSSGDTHTVRPGEIVQEGAEGESLIDAEGAVAAYRAVCDALVTELDADLVGLIPVAGAE